MSKKIFVLITIFCFIVYNLNIVPISKTDSLPAALLPFNILSGHGVHFDQFIPTLKQYYANIYFFEKLNGHFVSSFPLIAGLLSLPLYLPFYFYLKITAQDTIADFLNYSLFLEKITASLITSISVAFFYFLIYKLSKNIKISLIFSFVFAFALQNLVSSFTGLFFSPSRGIIFYTPFYILSIASIFFWPSIHASKFKNFYLLNVFYLILGVLLISLWGLWWGGESWGNRFFTATLIQFYE